MLCSVCGKRAYSDYCMQHKPRKPIQNKTPLPRQTKPMKQKGKRTIEYEHWRDTVARPYLANKYGTQCSKCQLPAGQKEDGSIAYHDVDHIKERGSYYHLRMTLSNVRFLCRRCHTERSNELKKASRCNTV